MKSAFSEEDVAKAIAMRAEGMTWIKIAESLGTSLSHAFRMGTGKMGPGQVRSPKAPVDSITHEQWLVMAINDAERFWSKVDKDGPTIRPELGSCWIWMASKTPSGYGKFSVFGPKGSRLERVMPSHRLSLEMEIGAIDPKLLALHACDVPSCVRPSHLRPGTQKQNRADSIERGRVPRGERHHRAKMTSEDVIEAKRLRASGATYTEIANKLGVGKAGLHMACGGYTWKHLP